jgi:hypothetical protein
MCILAKYFFLSILSTFVGFSIVVLYMSPEQGIPISAAELSVGSQEILKRQPQGVPLSQEQLQAIKRLEDKGGSRSVRGAVLGELMYRWWWIFIMCIFSLFLAWRFGFRFAYSLVCLLLLAVWLPALIL